MRPREAAAAGAAWVAALLAYGALAGPPVGASREERAARKQRVTGTNRTYLIDERRYTWYLEPNTIMESKGIVYETNSFGLRDVEFPLAKPSGATRIVCLGDSVTYGGGVAFADTYEQQLEHALDPGGGRVKVVNAGIGSHCAWHGLERVDADAIRFDPDVVTIAFGLNDGVLSPRTLREQWRAKLAEIKAAGGTAAEAARVATAPEPESKALVPSVPLDEFAEHMRALVARIRAKTKARVYLVAFNPISDAYQAQEWSAAVRERQRAVYGTYRERTIALGRELAAPVVDVYPLFEPSPAALLLPDGIHPNRDGMAVYARALERQLAKDLGRR